MGKGDRQQNGAAERTAPTSSWSFSVGGGPTQAGHPWTLMAFLVPDQQSQGNGQMESQPFLDFCSWAPLSDAQAESLARRAGGVQGDEACHCPLGWYTVGVPMTRQARLSLNPGVGLGGDIVAKENHGKN